MRFKSSQRVRVPDDAVRAVLDSIIFDHADFLVLNKPPGLAVHAGSGVPYGLIDALQQGLDAPTLELTHRLDKDTSGALLVARNAGTNRQLQDLFRDRRVDKRYQALVDGQWPEALSEEERREGRRGQDIRRGGEPRLGCGRESEAVV